MHRQAKQKFNGRAVVSVTTGLSFLGMSISGIVLFVTPFGRVAHWTGWRMLALTKEQWAALHIWFSLLFMAVAVFHIYLNWRSLLNYFKDKVRNTFALGREWVLSVVICSGVLAGTLADVAPFSSLLAWNEVIKHSWEVPGQQAPVPHAELMTLAEIAEKVKNVDVEALRANLESKGIKIESTDVIFGQLAQANNLTPYQLYGIALGQSGLRADSARTRREYGIGQLTLRQYCDRAGLEINTATAKLQNRGIEAEPHMLMRDIAHSAGVHASDIRDILEQ